MDRLASLALVLVLTLGGCSGDGGDDVEAQPSPSASFPFATVLLDNGEESTLVTVEVAETPEQQERGLEGRTSLPDDEGMVFVFIDGREDFPAHETPIPLSVAFFDTSGTIVGIVDVEPCAKEPCPVYDAGDEYMGALAVNQGMFEEWDISEGDHVQLTR